MNIVVFWSKPEKFKFGGLLFRYKDTRDSISQYIFIINIRNSVLSPGLKMSILVSSGIYQRSRKDSVLCLCSFVPFNVPNCQIATKASRVKYYMVHTVIFLTFWVQY